eukprot:3813173-Lingulodinium_polyedra.AAC.1
MAQPLKSLLLVGERDGRGPREEIGSRIRGALQLVAEGADSRRAGAEHTLPEAARDVADLRGA